MVVVCDCQNRIIDEHTTNSAWKDDSPIKPYRWLVTFGDTFFVGAIPCHKFMYQPLGRKGCHLLAGSGESRYRIEVRDKKGLEPFEMPPFNKHDFELWKANNSVIPSTMAITAAQWAQAELTTNLVARKLYELAKYCLQSDQEGQDFATAFQRYVRNATE